MKTIFKLFLTTAVLLLVSVSMNAEVYSGDCGADGDNVKWTLDTETGLLSITGVGLMYNYNYNNYVKGLIPWYKYRQYIKNVIIPDGITSIGDYSFSDCTRLYTITIPSSVKSIGNSAFSGCTGLPIEDNLRYADTYLVEATNKNLSTYNIKEGTRFIGNAFFNCSKLTSITIPESVISIGNGAFERCSSLPIEDNLRYADTYLVGAVDITLSTYNIKEGTRFIGSRAFEDCSGLTSITIPEKVISIGDRAFYGCSGLTSINIPEGITTLGESAFFDCSGLTSINIPEGVTTIGESAFHGCSGLTFINIPESMTSIVDDVFNGCSGLTSIIIPKNVISIGVWAFYNCSGLTSINIPEGVTSIGNGAFSGCSGISKPTYNSSFFVRLPVSYEGEYVIPETIETICDRAFGGCFGLTSINIPESVTNIGQGAFSGCSGLTSFTIPEGVTSIEESAFYGCSGLTSINIPESMTSIGNYAFCNCSGLTSITIPESVTNIGKLAFYGCSGLTSINIPKNVTSIDWTAFQGCSVQKLIINGNITSQTFTKYYGYEKGYIIPSCIEINGNISDKLYCVDMSCLSDVKIGDKVTTLYNQMFLGCSALKKVTLGKDLQYIRNEAFKNCTALDSVICYSDEPPYCYPGVFDGTDLSKCTLVVSKHSIDKYKETAPWSEFGTISARQSFTLTYMVNGEVYKTEDYEQGESIESDMPEREGYTFSGWSNLPESMPAENITVTGTFTINQYWVTYEVDGKTYTAEKLDYGSAITPPTMQEKEGCDFVWEDYPENVPASDITIKGRYVPRTYILTYVLNGVEYKTIEVTYGSDIQPEEIAEREGYTFSGWEGLPNTMPAGNVTVTGSFTINRYTLTYILNGEVYKTEEVEYGSSIIPEMPEMEGYIFSGWEGLPDTMPASDVTVTATFVANSFTLTYLIDGEEYKTYTLTFGADITPENAPEREGYTFSGWDGLPGTMPAGNVTVTGHYTVNEYWVTYMVDGKPYTSEKIAYGSVIVPPEVPEKEGFEFEWSYIPDTMPAKDIMVYGSYTTGIAEIMADQNVAGIYSIDGKRLSRPQRGLNIIRMKDGTVKRVMAK